MTDRRTQWTVTLNLSNSLLYDAIREAPHSNRADIERACRYMAYGRRGPLIALYSEVLGR